MMGIKFSEPTNNFKTDKEVAGSHPSSTLQMSGKFPTFVLGRGCSAAVGHSPRV